MSPTCPSDKTSMKMKVIMEYCWSGSGDSGIRVETFMSIVGVVVETAVLGWTHLWSIVGVVVETAVLVWTHLWSIVGVVVETAVLGWTHL